LLGPCVPADFLPVTNAPVRLRDVVVQWGRIGCIGFGGPPAHIALLRELCVRKRQWLSASEFEDGIAACNLLPGPASTQLAIFCAWRVAGLSGAIVGGLSFIVPGLVVILGLAAVFLASSPPTWVLGAGAGAGAAVAAVAVSAGIGLIPASRRRASQPRWRWIGYAVAGGIASATIGPLLVVVLVGCGFVELACRRFGRARGLELRIGPLAVAAVAPITGGVLALAWVAFKVGALAYGGGFVIIPIMQSDAVHQYHWMTNSQFLDAVALGQITPGPVTLTVAVVGNAAAGIRGALLAALVAFSPSFLFVLVGAPHFEALRHDFNVRAFLDGAGPAAIGAIIGVAVPLALALREAWQYGLLAAAAVVLFALRKGVVVTLLLAAVAGVVAVQVGAPVR
jgi:chromate transporter